MCVCMCSCSTDGMIPYPSVRMIRRPAEKRKKENKEKHLFPVFHYPLPITHFVVIIMSSRCLVLHHLRRCLFRAPEPAPLPLRPPIRRCGF